MTKGNRRRWRRAKGAPTVVFVDDVRWDAFTQLSTRLHRAGVRTVRLTTRADAWSRATSSLDFDRHEILAEGVESAVIAQVFEEEHVVDVQFVETLGDLVGKHLALLDRDVATSVAKRLELTDKLAAARRFESAGVRTPAVRPADSTTPAAVAEDWGLPVVAKRRVGCGGDNVVIAADLAELEAASRAWEGDEDARYYERYVEGIKLNYAAAVGPGGIDQEMAYRVSRWRMPAGTATEIETVDDAALVDLGRRALQASGCTGLVNLDVMRDVDGTDWLIDFNSRAFGGAMNFLSVGLDVSEGYLRSLGLREEPPTMRTPPVGARIAIFPTSLSDERNLGSTRRMAAAFASESWPYLRWLGPRYWASELLRVPDVAAARRRARRASAS